MDDLDKKILELLAHDARMTVKDIAHKISLTSPAVSQRIKRMEDTGVIKGYTVVLGDNKAKKNISAIVCIALQPKDKDKFFELIEKNKHVRRCFHVTGNYSYILYVNCLNMAQIEEIINEFQQLGQTNTQIVMSTAVDRFVDYNFLFEK